MKNIIFALVIFSSLFAVNRNGTTTANFLEIDMGSAASAMGGAYVSVANDVSSIYWNPAGLTGVHGVEFMFNYQPYLVGIDQAFIAGAVNTGMLGTFAGSVNFINYGDEAVTTVRDPEGTGELYKASEYALTVSYARRIVDWFSFGASGKLISSSIWHTTATAGAVDLGVIITTNFLVPNGQRDKGLKIGMSISNYGSRLRYDGMDLLNPIDISDEYGNFANVPGIFKTEQWELPLIFRIGTSINYIATDTRNLILSIDALHPNNNSESINIGGEYSLTIPGLARFYLRAGYKGQFMVDSEYGLTFGAGMKLRIAAQQNLRIDYTNKKMGRLGNVNLYTIGLEM